MLQKGSELFYCSNSGIFYNLTILSDFIVDTNTNTLIKCRLAIANLIELGIKYAANEEDLDNI